MLLLEDAPRRSSPFLTLLSSCSFTLNSTSLPGSNNVTYSIMLTAARDLVHFFLNGDYIGELLSVTFDEDCPRGAFA